MASHTVESVMEACANCGRSIGRLETAHVHGEHVVCNECHGRIAAPPPIAYATPGAPPARVQTVQSTAKVWKAAQAIGVLAIFTGVILIGTGMQKPVNDAMSGGGVLLFVLGFGANLVGRIFAWWFHG